MFVKFYFTCYIFTLGFDVYNEVLTNKFFLILLDFKVPRWNISLMILEYLESMHIMLFG